MAQYATLEDLQDTGLPPGVLDGVPDPNRFLERASAHVDSYLRGRYSVPLVAPYPSEISDAVIAIAAYRIMMFRGFDSESQDSLFVDRFEYYCGKPGQLGWLDKLSKGQVNLDVNADQTPAQHEGGAIVASKNSPIVTSSCRSGRGWNSGGFI